MRFSAFIVLLISFTHAGFGQIIIGPLSQGEFFNEVIYEGVYYSPGNCTWADGSDFVFDFSGLAEVDGMEYVLVIDEPDPDSTFMMNGWLPVYAGDSTAFTPTTSGLGISASSNPAALHFHIRLVGTPTKAGQVHPCWIDQVQTLSDCNNVWGLFNGETLLTCTVQTTSGLAEEESKITINQIDGQLRIHGLEDGQVQLYSLDGKLILESSITSGISRIDLPKMEGPILVQIQTDSERFTKKMMVQ